LVQFVLSKEGYEVKAIDDSRAALPVIQQREPDLLIADIIMPHLDGFELVQKLRGSGYAFPIIFVSAKNTLEDRLRGFELGADDYICKPYNHLELIARVRVVERRTIRKITDGNISISCGRMTLFPETLKV